VRVGVIIIYYYIILLLYYYIIIYLLIFHPLLPLYSSNPLFPSPSHLPFPILLIHSILVGTYIYLTIFLLLPFPLPSVLSSSFILYLSILIYYYLYSHHLISSSPIICSPILSFILYLSILIYVYLYSIHLSSLSHYLFLLNHLYSSHPSHLTIFCSSFSNPPHSFYTCRGLRMFIYISSGYSYSRLLNNLTPHVLSEACLEWCSFICVVFELVWV
jgi:hypothetical protein